MTGRLRARLRTIAIGGRLGWAIESNWADPFVFAIYFLLRPVATTLILVVIYKVATRAPLGTPGFAYLYLGSAFFQYVGQVLFGISSTIQEDREHYQMLKYVWSAPISTVDYLLGRGLTKIGSGTVAVAVTILFGVLVLDIRFEADSLSPGAFALALALGLVTLVSLGILFAGIELNKTHTHNPWQEGAAGVLFLFSGVIFPPETLPRILHPIAYALPTTWWLESVRRSLTGGSWCQALSGWSDVAVLGVLAASTALVTTLSFAAYRVLDGRARAAGKIDLTTGF